MFVIANTQVCLLYDIEFGQNDFSVMRYVKEQNLHGHKHPFRSCEKKKKKNNLTESNAKLIKRIVKAMGKTNLLEFFSVSVDNLSKGDEKKNQESL